MSDKAGKVTWVKVDDLEPNPWNPNRMNAFMYAKALESIQTFGFVDPVTCWDAGNFRLQIIDGEHRWKAARDLGLVEIPVFIADLKDETQAKKLTILLNELRGQSLPEDMGALLKDLMATESMETLLEQLPYTEDMFRGLVSDLPPLPSTAPTTRSEGTPEPERRWVERLYRMPAAAAQVLDDALARAKAGDEIEDWQALERLAADYLAG